MIGNKNYNDTTKLLNKKLGSEPFLIAVHRGSSMGNIIENTLPAFYAAMQSGADILEIDVVRSSDGKFYLFHDGNERRLLGQDKNIRQMDSVFIESLNYRNNIGQVVNYKVEKLENVLTSLKGSGMLLNLDRSWDDWNTLLPFLDQFDMADQIILKSPVIQSCLSILEQHPVKYPYMPIVKKLDEIDEVLSYEDINLTGMELIAEDRDSVFFQDDIIRGIKERELFIWLNAIVLNHKDVLYAKYDDDQSIIKGPAYGWGKLVEKGCDIIQTDWPSLLDNYRQEISKKND
ncbi:glycerophosphodiester phosphodiesterase family protein [Metabacillus rhizolycopersici]|uniref:Glycerophosphodiester phosphodiesterase family protein n=1 Tax=Metabacillus rhizolycopersici TaxID=2875709 RepID=A0ABS7UU02_9BACI|nr:glycerophosphodiester phosphodiesterase family protein [Metabacillus rhizolycopersici]MBZ5751792.1 glycerophosphodiester phosphodiesterase family protein [Metabacillus rhizolycopersici]